MAGIFKAYDIRGVYGETFTDEIAFEVGRAFATFLKCGKVAVGRDMRPHSKPVFASLADGLTMQGVDVVDVGLCSTPMCYYAIGSLGVDAGIMITASHNPGEWNGLKLTRGNAIPLSGDTGIADIERIVAGKAFDEPAAPPGSISSYDILDEYRGHVAALAEVSRPVSVAVDMANAVGIIEAKALEGLIHIDPIFDVFQ